MSIRTPDGAYTVYMLQHDAKGQWVNSSLDYFGTPKGFSASDACWQETLITGTFDTDVGVAGLSWLANKHRGTTFRLVKVEVSKTTTQVATMVRTEEKK